MWAATSMLNREYGYLCATLLHYLFLVTILCCEIADAQSSWSAGSEWVLVAEELAGSPGSDAMRTLAIDDVPSFFRVRIEWGTNGDYVAFDPPPDTTIFGDFIDPTIPLTNFESSSFGILDDGPAIFCKMCSESGADRFGDTCWAILPIDEPNRA